MPKFEIISCKHNCDVFIHPFLEPDMKYACIYQFIYILVTIMNDIPQTHQNGLRRNFQTVFLSPE